MSDKSYNYKEILLSPIFANNPIGLQVIGICSALAVTRRTENPPPPQPVCGGGGQRKRDGERLHALCRWL